MTERMIPSIDNRLTNWAEWIEREKRGAFAQGRSIIATLIDSKGVISRSSGQSSGMPDVIYDTDRAVRHVEQKCPLLGMVIREHYQNTSSSAEQKQTACGCSNGTYYRRLAQAHHAILMLLSAGKQTRSRERITVRQLKKAG